MGGCRNYGPFLGTLNIRCRIIMGIQKGTIILTTTHMYTGDEKMGGDTGNLTLQVSSYHLNFQKNKFRVQGLAFGV